MISRNFQMVNLKNENDILLKMCQHGAYFLSLTFVLNPYGLKLIIEVLNHVFGVICEMMT
jgi:hypothetical protein